MNLYDELITILQDGKELGFTYDEIDDIIKALTRAEKVEELLGLYRLHYRNGMEYNHNGKLIHQIVKLEGELK